MEGKKKKCSSGQADRSLLEVSPSVQLSNIVGSCLNKSLTGSGKKKKLSVDPQISMSYLSEESTTSESDEEEISEKEPHNKTPKTKKQKEEDKDLSIVNKMTEEEMKDHVSCCLKLSNENKISSKNAFALKLIDCMTQLARKEDDKNFTALACQLDAGAKIYSHRVDAVHHQVIKLAESCVYAEGNKKKDGKTNEEEDEDAEAKEHKPKKKNKKRLILPPEMLTRKLKGKDPRTNFIRLSARPGEILMKAKHDAVTLALTLDNDTPCWPSHHSVEPDQTEDICELPDMDLFFMKTRRIGPPLKEIEEEMIRLSIAAKLENIGQPSTSEATAAGSDDHDNHYEEMDHDGDIDAEGAENINHDIEYEIPNQDNEVEVIAVARQRMRKELGRDPSRLEVMKAIFHNEGESEYHYLRMSNSRLWAGPSYWKRPQVTATAALRKKSVRTRKEPTEIEYDDAAVTALASRWSSTAKRSTVVSKRTLSNWNQKKVTLPSDIQFNFESFKMLFNIETSAIKFMRQPKGIFSNIIVKEGQFDDHYGIDDDPIELSMLDSSDTQDSQELEKTQVEMKMPFPTPPTTNSDDSQPTTSFHTSDSVDTYEGDNLVPMVKVVKVEPIKYTTKPNRVDMRHLKEVMLTIIEREIKDKENRAQGAQDFLAFKDILNELFNTNALNSRTKQDLTVAMAFLALLTLTNEEGFSLEQDGDIHDIIIRLDPKNDEVPRRNLFDN